LVLLFLRSLIYLNLYLLAFFFFKEFFSRGGSDWWSGSGSGGGGFSFGSGGGLFWCRSGFVFFGLLTCSVLGNSCRSGDGGWRCGSWLGWLAASSFFVLRPQPIRLTKVRFIICTRG